MGSIVADCQYDVLNTVQQVKGLIKGLKAGRANQTFYYAEKVLKSFESAYYSCENIVSTFQRRMDNNKNCSEAMGIAAFAVALIMKKQMRISDVVRAVPVAALSASIVVAACVIQPEPKTIRLNEESKEVRDTRFREFINRVNKRPKVNKLSRFRDYFKNLRANKKNQTQ
eukprot:TRINITY_DN12603_c0_g1_i2.p1 TRINITY_DN12603_c0_g1~~TRINITY_DN12603_c0_g1_i2.p1  ORF type:complete len:170 (-),score=46.69 TRINITY_DN12603_c0_g1_i2:90-599(-)